MKQKRFLCLLLALVLLASLLTGCKKKTGLEADSAAEALSETDEQPAVSEELNADIVTPIAEATLSPVERYWSDEANYGPLVSYSGIVEHLFFHPLVAYPELAFDGDSKEAGIDDWMVTVSEFKKILQSLYDNDYILVNMNDVWSEGLDENGNPVMQKNTLMLPEGKKPIILSFDDVNYYEYMLENGFAYKLIIGDDGEMYSYGLDPQGNEIISQELDAIPILNKFVNDNPDFSLFGVKGCLALTGYEGILGYRTSTDKNDTSAERETFRQSEIVAVKPIVEKLKEDGWYFGCHSFSHLNLANASYEAAVNDCDRWLSEVGSLVGETRLYFYPFGGRADGDDVKQTGPAFTYMQGKGFRVFASVGIESYSKIKTDICAVICDRMHADGTTLRHSRQRYLKFYDAAEVFDYDARPDFGYDFS